MQTTRQIEKLWNARQYDRLANELLNARMEYSPRLVTELGRAVPAAALAIVRLDELNQGHHPLNQKLIRTIIAAQEGDGGWGDLMVSALCVRALMCGRGMGVAVHQGLGFLANLQKDEGIWPAMPLRRTAEDAYTSAFILFQLADQEAFRATVRIDAAIEWFTRNESHLDAETRKLWRPAGLRARIRPTVLAAA